MIGTAMMKRNVSRSRLNCSHSLRSSANEPSPREAVHFASLHAEHVDEDIFEAAAALPAKTGTHRRCWRISGFERGARSMPQYASVRRTRRRPRCRQVPHAAGRPRRRPPPVASKRHERD